MFQFDISQMRRRTRVRTDHSFVRWSSIRIKGGVSCKYNWFKSPNDLYRCPFQGGYSDVNHFCCNSSIVVTRYTAAHFAFCFLVRILALWSSTSTAAHLAFYFLVRILALWSSTSTAAHLAFYFLVRILALWSSTSTAAHLAF